MSYGCYLHPAHKREGDVINVIRRIGYVPYIGRSKCAEDTDMRPLKQEYSGEHRAKHILCTLTNESYGRRGSDIDCVCRSSVEFFTRKSAPAPVSRPINNIWVAVVERRRCLHRFKGLKLLSGSFSDISQSQCDYIEVWDTGSIQRTETMSTQKSSSYLIVEVQRMRYFKYPSRPDVRK